MTENKIRLINSKQVYYIEKEEKKQQLYLVIFNPLFSISVTFGYFGVFCNNKNSTSRINTSFPQFAFYWTYDSQINFSPIITAASEPIGSYR